jgi:hypothetical protein
MGSGTGPELIQTVAEMIDREAPLLFLPGLFLLFATALTQGAIEREL